jgi:hypothetical protein
VKIEYFEKFEINYFVVNCICPFRFCQDLKLLWYLQLHIIIIIIIIIIIMPYLS